MILYDSYMLLSFLCVSFVGVLDMEQIESPTETASYWSKWRSRLAQRVPGDRKDPTRGYICVSLTFKIRNSRSFVSIKNRKTAKDTQ